MRLNGVFFGAGARILRRRRSSEGYAFFGVMYSFSGASGSELLGDGRSPPGVKSWHTDPRKDGSRLQMRSTGSGLLHGGCCFLMRNGGFELVILISLFVH